MKKIILLGYMGSGKSVIAKLLSQKTNLPYKDLDEIIEQHENATIKSIFEQRGEIYFRKLEHALLKQLMDVPDSFVLSLGGGTPCYAGNDKLLQGNNIHSFYLKASIDTLFERLARNKTKRPLIAAMDDLEMKEFIAKHLFERSFFYNKAQHVIAVDHKSPTVIVCEIENLI